MVPEPDGLVGVFVADVLTGLASSNDIWTYVERWRDVSGQVTLSRYLGFTLAELQMWEKNTSLIEMIVDSRRVS